MKLVPRDYQYEAVYSVFRYFDQHKSQSGDPLIVLPTGTGKSIVIAEFARLLLEWFPGQRLMMLTHVKELIQQNYDKLLAVWPEAPAGIYSSSLKRRDVHHEIIFAGIASVAKKAKEFGNVSIILVDEAHLISPRQQTMYQKFIADLRKVNPYLRVVGLTATPFRLGFGPIYYQNGDENLGIQTMFSCVTFNASSVEFFNWFINEGYLLPVIPKRTVTQLDVTGVKKSQGDYNLTELQTAVNKQEVTKAAIDEALELGADRKSWLVFCSGVEHSIDVAEELCRAGVPAKAVHSKMSTAERDQAIKDFKSGKLRALTNNNVLTTGFDFPGIDLLIILRPTQSPILWVQMLGRGTRPKYVKGFDINVREERLAAIQLSDKHDCLVLDFSGNSRKLGPINDPNIPRRPGDKGGGQGIYKTCTHCNTDGQPSAWRFCGGLEAVNITGMTVDQIYELYKKGYRIEPGKSIATAGPGYCGKPFVFKEKLKRGASTQELVKQAEPPKVENLEVLDIIYQKNVNRYDPSKPDTLKVTYHCVGKNVDEYVPLMHTDWAGRKGYRWWKSRTSLPLPENIDDALEVVSTLKIPTHIKVQKVKKFYEVLACCYDGTCFGTLQTPVGTDIGVQVYSARGIFSNRAPGSDINMFDRDEVSYEDIVNNHATSHLNITPANVNTTEPDDIPF